MNSENDNHKSETEEFKAWLKGEYRRSPIEEMKARLLLYLERHSFAYQSVHYLGYIILLSSLPMAIPTFVAYFIDGNIALMYSFMLSMLLGLFIGVPMVGYFRAEELSVGRAMGIAALAWLVMPFFGSLPYIFSIRLTGYGLSPVDAYFESMSGYTATGLTMFLEVESLPKSILLWRSITQYIGGVGVVVLFLSILITTTGNIAQKLYLAEGRSDRFAPTVEGTARRIWAIYGLYMVIGFVILAFLGVPLFDAINTSMTALATGGFSVRNNSIGAYRNLNYSLAIELTMVILMFLGATSFTLHYKILRGNIRDFFRDPEVRMFIGLIIFSIFIFYMQSSRMFTPEFIATQLRYNGFQTVSALSGAGFQTMALAPQNQFFKLGLVILMITGGGYGSTASALKLLRVRLLLSSVVWIIKKTIYPRGTVVPIKMGKAVYDKDDIISVLAYTLVYLVLLLIATGIFVAGNRPLVDSVFEVASAQGNVGLSVGITTPLMPIYEKITLIMVMWLGRLEIFPVLILFSLGVSKRTA